MAVLANGMRHFICECLAIVDSFYTNKVPSSDVHGPGEMKIGVYHIQTMGSDLYVGGVKEPIDSFVTEEKRRMFCFPLYKATLTQIYQLPDHS